MTTEQSIIAALGAIVAALVAYLGVRGTARASRDTATGTADASKFGVFLTSLVNRLAVVEEHQAKCESDLAQARAELTQALRDTEKARQDMYDLSKVVDRMRTALDKHGIVFQ